ncbi:MAG: HD domain-containing protein [Stackebrandtia sp.]
MSVLSPPRHPKTDHALALARQWCAGHVIDAAPALKHAVAVALTLDRHMPQHPPELTAAVLLHDAPEFAPPTVDLDTLLTDRFGAETTRIVRTLETFHQALHDGTPPNIDPADTPTMLAATADKIVAFSSILGRANQSGEPGAFWRARKPFRDRLPWFRAFHAEAAARVPDPMSAELAQLLAAAETATGFAPTDR